MKFTSIYCLHLLREQPAKNTFTFEYSCIGFQQVQASAFEYHLHLFPVSIAANNPRSLKAHMKTGFQVVDQLNYGVMNWDIVLWDWTI